MYELSGNGASLPQAVGGRVLLIWALRLQGTFAWAKSNGGGNTATSILDSRGGHGPPPLGVHEQAPPMTQVTSRVTTEEGTSTKCHSLPSLPWECTCHAVATVKGSECCLQLSECHCHFPGPCKQEQPILPPCGCLPLSKS